MCNVIRCNVTRFAYCVFLGTTTPVHPDRSTWLKGWRCYDQNIFKCGGEETTAVAFFFVFNVCDCVFLFSGLLTAAWMGWFHLLVGERRTVRRVSSPHNTGSFGLGAVPHLLPSSKRKRGNEKKHCFCCADSRK